VTRSPGASLPSAIIDQIQSAISAAIYGYGIVYRLSENWPSSCVYVGRPCAKHSARALVGLVEFRQGSSGGAVITSDADAFLSRVLVTM
jgi:hypothetical protein